MITNELIPPDDNDGNETSTASMSTDRLLVSHPSKQNSLRDRQIVSPFDSFAYLGTKEHLPES